MMKPICHCAVRSVCTDTGGVLATESGDAGTAVWMSSPVNRLGWERATSTPDAVVHVGDAIPLEDAGALEFDLPGTQVVEQTTPLAEEHGDDIEFELVEKAGVQCELSDGGAVDEHVPVAGRFSASVMAVLISVT